MIVQFNQVQKYFGAHLALSNIQFELKEGEKAGLIGRNGEGKSTVLKLVSGELAPDHGHIAIRKGTTIGYLAQISAEQETATVLDVLKQAFHETIEARSKMQELEASMADSSIAADSSLMDRVLIQYAELQERFERAGGYEMEARIDQVAHGMGIPESQYTRLFSSLSGGEQTKVGLASLLLRRPNLLLLDEPTNHLDMSAVEWLEQYLSDYEGTCLIASHDRYFLDRVAKKIVEIEDGEAVTYLTNYSGYQTEKQERLLQQFADYEDQQKKIKQMKEAIKRYTEWGRIGGNEKFFKRAESIRKALERMDKVKRPVMERRTAAFKLEHAQRSGQDVVTLKNVSKSFGSKALFNGISEALAYGDKTVLIGSNGAGKSTLFKLMLGHTQADEGEVRLGARVDIGYLAQESAPEEDRTVLEHFRDEAGMEEGEARGRLARYLFYGADVFKSIKSLSGGEWTRLRLALLMHRMPNLLLLDEPTNHLDIASREALEEALEDFPGTLLAISHDRYFMNRLADRIWSLQDGTLISTIGNFEDFKEQEARRIKTVPSVAVKPAEVRNESIVTVQEPAKQRTASKSAAPRSSAVLESNIAALEQRIALLDEELQKPDISTNAPRLSELLAEQERLQAELDRLYADWIRQQ